MRNSDALSQQELDVLLEDVTCDIPNELHIHGSTRPGGCPVVTIQGRILGTTASQVVFEKLTALQTFKHDLFLDLRECEFLSSIAIGMIVTLAQKQHDCGCRLHIVGAKSIVRRSIFVLGLRHVLDLLDEFPENA